MNILFLSSEFPTPVDPNRAVFNRQMIRGLAARHRVQVVCPIAWTEAVRAKPQPALPASEAFAAHYPRFYFPPRLSLHRRGDWMWWSVRRRLLKDAERFRPEVVLSYYAHPDGEVAQRLARRLGVPVALMVGGSDVLLVTKDPRRRQRVEAVLRGVDAVVTIGGNLRERVVAMGVPGERVTSVMRPVDAARFAPGDRSQARQRRGLPLDRPVVLWVGRLVPVKAVDTLLRAVALLREQHPSLVLCLVGEGPEAGTLRALSGQLGLESLVRWLGAVAHDDLPDWYRAADVTVLPSLSEGVPNVLLESVACGTPFVASRVGSIPEIADDACDRLVPPGEAAALATAIGEVLAGRDTVAVRARGVAAEPAFQARLDDILTRCVAAPSSSRAPDRALRSATLVKPKAWRQAARTLLLDVTPRRWLVAAGQSASGAVCLTFDDGPHASITPQLLDVLKAHGAVATFFVRGDRASTSPAILRRIVDDGHLLGHHSWSHAPPNETSAVRLMGEVRRTRDWLRDQFGAEFTWFRPPHGKVSAAKVLGLWAAGMTIALWNVDPGDVYRNHPRELIDWFAANPPRAGDVVLLHDTSTVTLEALPQLIEMIRTAGLDLTTLDSVRRTIHVLMSAVPRSTSPPVVYFGNDWFADNRTSSHHVARQLAARTNVLYVECPGLRAPEASSRDAMRVVRKVARAFRPAVEVGDGLTVKTLVQWPAHRSPTVARLNRTWSRATAKWAMRGLGSAAPVAWCTVPHVANFVESLGARAIVYHCIDDYAALPGVDAEAVRAMDDRLTRAADLVIAASGPVFESRRALNPNTLLVPHGVDFEHFAGARREGDAGAARTGRCRRTDRRLHGTRRTVDRRRSHRLAGWRTASGDVRDDRPGRDSGRTAALGAQSAVVGPETVRAAARLRRGSTRRSSRIGSTPRCTPPIR